MIFFINIILKMITSTNLSRVVIKVIGVIKVIRVIKVKKVIKVKR